MRTRYQVERAQLTAAIATFVRERDLLIQRGQWVMPPPIRQEDQPVMGPPGALAKIGDGTDALPDLPEPIKSFHGRNVDSVYVLKLGASCDDVFGAFGQNGASPILEQCRHVVAKFNRGIQIAIEHNYYRGGECRSGKSALQTGQASLVFPYCDNPCRFGQTTCVKCDFRAGISSFYLCGDEADARNAIDTHCREGHWECSGATAKCSAPQQFNEAAMGTTALRESDTRFSVKAAVTSKIEAESTFVGVVRGLKETSFEVTLDGDLVLKNRQGAPIMTAHGGETATTYTCSVGVSMGIVRSMAVEVGVGFEGVVASGSITAGLNTELTALTQYKTTSRDIPAAGQPLVNMLEGCRRFSLEWARSDLPALIARNVVLRTVASPFMSKTGARVRHRMDKLNIWCKTPLRASRFSKIVQYRIDDTYWKLEPESLEFQYAYSGTINPIGYNSPVFRFTHNQLGDARYAELRKIVFDGTLDRNANTIMRLIETAYRFDGYVDQCRVGQW